MERSCIVQWGGKNPLPEIFTNRACENTKTILMRHLLNREIRDDLFLLN